MNLMQAAVLGLLQGLTEFLPVSSSGHLVLGQAFLGIEQSGITFEVFVHFGTLLAVVTAFRQDIIQLVREFVRLFSSGTYQNGLGTIFRSSEYFRLMIYIIIGTIPAAVIGLLFEDTIESAFNNPRLTCLMLAITGVILLGTRFIKNKELDLTCGRSLFIGFAQAMAILPGISRSGATISVGLYQGVNSNRAAHFSFLLSLPAILGATILKLSELFTQLPTLSELWGLVLGTIVAYGSGYIAIILLLNLVRRGKLYWFAPYCFLVALIGFIFL